MRRSPSNRLCALFTAGSLLAWAAPAAADSYKFVTLDYPPLEYQAADGKAAGALVDIVHELMEGLGHKVDIQVLPWARSISQVKDGKADAIFTAYRNPERETFLEFSREVLIDQVMSLFVKKGSLRGFHGSLSDLAGATIGTVSTISYGGIFDKARQTLKTERVESLDLNFKKLMVGRIDYVISNRYSAEAEIAGLGLTDAVVELEPSVEVIPSFIGFSRKNTPEKLRLAFDKALVGMKRSGRYQAILAKWKVRAPHPGG